ncbi:MAG: tRNA (adenosine(37)-N6)-dimethylallyltransferase MiaA [Firmicutes bacterium]|nr:tRNA (adenosine(37)-N6)-dimethylallyltransferase MiaA [Bacillota bacterium]
MTKIPLLVIVGPTAVGKTALSLKLAEELKGEIISADSMQIYQGMDIGTAKPSPAEQARIPHHLIDVVPPTEAFNVQDWVMLAEEAIQDITLRGNTPIVSGGTGLYVNALIDGFLFPDTSADPELRRQLEQRGRENPSALHKELADVDPETAQRLHPNDIRRVVRALEVYYRTGEPISTLQKKASTTERPYELLYIGLTRDRAELYERINLRVDQMIDEGLIEEVRTLVERFLESADDPAKLTALQALGYKEIIWGLTGEKTMAEAVELLKRDTRRYAKRQLSWFKRDERIRWFNLSHTAEYDVIKTVTSLWQELFEGLR